MTTIAVGTMSQPMLIIHPVQLILNFKSQSQLVTLKVMTLVHVRIMILSFHQNAWSARLWKFLSALIKTRSTMQRACATTATTSMVETATPMLAPTQIDLSMPRANARTAISMTITSSRESSRRKRLPVPLNSSMTPSLPSKDSRAQ